MPWTPKTFDEMRAEAEGRIAERRHRLKPQPSALPVAPLLPTPTITFGQFETGAPLEWPIIKMAPRHMLASGSTGFGKTNFMTAVERDFILAGGGNLSIDRDGSHPRSKFIEQLKWIDETGLYKHRTVHVLDLNDHTAIIPFNNLSALPGVHPSVLGDETSVAFQRISGENWTEKPLLEAIMTDLLTSAAVLGWTICDVKLLLDSNDEAGVRRWAIENIGDDYLRSTLLRIDDAATSEKSKRDFRAMTQGPLNRLSDIERFEKTRLIAGAGPRFDLAAAMDRGDIILIDASSGGDVGETAVKTFCSLVIRALYSTMTQRRDPDRLFLVTIDEAASVIKGQEDTQELVGRARKYGVCLFFNLLYLQQATPEQYLALKNCTNTRIAFRSADHKEAEEHVLDLVPIDMERHKSTMVRPTAVGVERTSLKSRSQANHQSHGHSQGETESSSESQAGTDAFGGSQASGVSTFDAQSAAESASAGQVLSPPSDMLSPPGILSQSTGAGAAEGSVSGAGASQMSGSMWMQAQTSGSARGRASSSAFHTASGTSEGVTDAEAFETLYRDLPTQLFSLEESIHQAARTLKTFEPGEAIVAFGNMSAKIRVRLLPSANVTKEENAALRRRFIDASPSSISIADARAALEARKASIIAAARKRPQPPPEPDLKKREPAVPGATPATAGPPPVVQKGAAFVEDPDRFAEGFWERLTKKEPPDDEPEPPSPKKPKRPPRKPFKPKLVGGNPDIPAPKKPRDPKPL